MDNLLRSDDRAGSEIQKTLDRIASSQETIALGMVKSYNLMFGFCIIQTLILLGILFTLG